MRTKSKSGSGQSDTLVEGSRVAWFALQVRSQHEKGVVDRLEGTGGCELFLPLYKCRKRWSDRIKEFEVPLFPGYIFCRFDPMDRLPVLKTPGVIQIVSANHVPIPLDEAEIRAVQTLVASGIPNQPWPFLEVGDRVRIESGPLTGVEGILTAFKGKNRLLISISLLQRSVAAEIDSAYVTLQSPARGSRPERKGYLEPRPTLVTV
jgi:transcription antitermination factor NusG